MIQLMVQGWPGVKREHWDLGCWHPLLLNRNRWNEHLWWLLENQRSFNWPFSFSFFFLTWCKTVVYFSDIKKTKKVLQDRLHFLNALTVVGNTIWYAFPMQLDLSFHKHISLILLCQVSFFTVGLTGWCKSGCKIHKLQVKKIWVSKKK